MKRVKCYGRMKTTRIDSSAKKIFFGDSDSLLDLSLGNENDSVPEKVVKRSSRPKRKVNYATSASPPLLHISDDVFESKKVPISDDSENQFPTRPKPKSRKVKCKTNVKKKTQMTKPHPSANVNEPRWSSISDHSLFVEKFVIGKKRQENPTLGSKRRNAFSNIKQLKRPPLVTIQNQQINHEEQPELGQLCSMVDISCQEVTSPKEQFVHPGSVNQTNVLKDSFNTNALNNVAETPHDIEVQFQSDCVHVEDPTSCQEVPNSKEQFVPPELMNQSNVLKDTFNSNSLNTVAKTPHDDIEVQTDCVNVEDHTSILKSNAKAQISVWQDQMNSFSDSIEKHPDSFKAKRMFSEEKNKSSNFVQNSTPILNAKKCGQIARLFNISSPNVSCILPTNLAHIRRSSSHKFVHSRNKSSSRKIFNIVTSTPNVLPKTDTHKNVSLSNLSQISAVSNLSKYISSQFSRSSVCFQNRVFNKRPSMSMLQNKTRSLDVQFGSSKCSHKQSHFSSSNILQPTLKSNKTRSCLEKTLPDRQSLTSFIDLNQSQSIVEKLIELCGQETIEAFATAYEWSRIPIRKIGEGTYGEVFMFLEKKKPAVIKIIPVSQDSTNTWLNVETVYSEVKVSQCLSNLRNNTYNKTTNFSKLNRVQFVKGCYPQELLVAWDTFSTVKTSYNTRPDYFDGNQLYVILELEYGGQDMTSFVMRNAVEAESILKQVAISLAIAEETHLFEHRDLHLGNILVQRVKKKAVSYILRGKNISIKSHGMMVTIIDFTLSRVFDSGCIYYNNLADDESLFNQTGDYQFEIYRATRENLKNQWHECSLFSNVLWLTFLCVKMQQYKYSHPASVIHLKSFNSISGFQNDLKSCKSAFDCLKMCKILSSIPKNDQSLDSKLTGKVVFVDRKSFQKSKLSIRNG